MFEIIYTVRRIDGDYAILIAEGQQDENRGNPGGLPPALQGFRIYAAVNTI